LFLSSGDLRNALLTASQCSDAYPELEIHLSDSCDIVTARNFLITHVIFSDSFDPSNPADLQYLWDLWYGSQWNDTTRQRFVRDVLELFENQSTHSSIIHCGATFNTQLNVILNNWLNTVCNMTISQTKQIVKQRYLIFPYINIYKY